MGRSLSKYLAAILNIPKEQALEEILYQVQNVRGVVWAFIDRGSNFSQYLIEVDREATARYGLNVGDLQDLVEIALGGKAATELWEGERYFSVVLKLKEPERVPMRLKDILINTPQGVRTYPSC